MAEEKKNIVRIISDYSSRLFGFIRDRVNSTEDAEDILQEIWFQLSSRPDSGAIESVSGWLYQVARNKITDKYRKKREEALDEDFDYGEETDWKPPRFLLAESTDPEAEQLRKLFWEELIHALGELPQNQRNVFVWNELEDKTLREIANHENENLKTIISRKRYAVLHLRTRLENLYNDFITD